MAHVLPSTDDATAWKTEIRQRVMINLEDLLHDAQLDYLRRVSESRLTTIEGRDKLFAEYNCEVQMMRNIAEDEIKAEIDRGERERHLGATLSGDLDQAFVEEQFAILNAIRRQSKVSPQEACHVAANDINKTHFRQSSSSSPLDAESFPTVSTSIIHSPTIVHPESETPAARLKREKHAKQQEEYRKRAEGIQERKKRERQEREERECPGLLQFTETMSCSSSSSNTTTEQEKSDGIPAMSEDDVINLMIFHDQQWTWISSLPHLQWSDFPWPYLSFAGPKRKEDLTPEAIGEYVHAQFNIHQDRAIVKEHLKNLIRRWHPDRFEIKYLSRVADLHERDSVRDGAGIVTRILNDLLGKWNGQ